MGANDSENLQGKTPCHIRPTAPNPDHRTELKVYGESDPSFPHQDSHFSFSISPEILLPPQANASHSLVDYSTKAAIAPRTKGTPVTAAKAAPPPLKILIDDVTDATGVNGDVAGSVVREVGGTVRCTVDGTVGATVSVTGVPMMEERM